MNQGTIFDITSWTFASPHVCKREQIFPNVLGYNESSATLCVIVKRSSGGDFALSQGGLNYLMRTLETGTLKDGAEVRAAIVVLIGVDDKPVKQFSAEELRDRFDDIQPQSGKFGSFWWISASAFDDGRF